MAERMYNIDRWRQYAIDSDNRRQRQTDNRMHQQQINQDLEKAELRRDASVLIAEMRRQVSDANAEIKRNNDEWRHIKQSIELEIKAADSETRRQALEARLEIAKDAVEQKDRALQQKADEFKAALEEKQFQFDNSLKKEKATPRGWITRQPPGGKFGESERIYFGTPEHDKLLLEETIKIDAKKTSEAAAQAALEAKKLEDARLGFWGRMKRGLHITTTPPPPQTGTNMPNSMPQIPGTNAMLPPPMALPTTSTATNPPAGIPILAPPMSGEGEWDLEGGMRAPAMSPMTNSVPSAVAPQFIVPPMPATNTPAINTPAAPSRKFRVRGPGGRTGTVPEGATLPEGWSFE